jgi:hypothetical protein
MATFSIEAVEIFGKGVLKSEGVVVDKENNVYGGGRNGVMYKVTPDGKVSESLYSASWLNPERGYDRSSG